ncbi:hypothetical protein FKP32DRAFT_1604866 [Trametes sanguinea]|nr:hypothetical protein FKP32DRAFT_1604866 [Trametes sanguinea]
MDVQPCGRAVRQPKPLRVVVPDIAALEEEEDEVWMAHYPSPPPPTPSFPRRETPFDEQRYDPFKAMLSPTSPPRYASPDLTFQDGYPQLADSAVYHYPTVGDAYDELLAYHLGNKEAGDDSEDLSPDTGFSTPSDIAQNHANVSTFRLDGAGEDGDFSIDRAILRKARSQRQFDLSHSLASLANRSTATLRRMRSFANSSEATTPSPGEDYDYGNIVVPPTSCATSRRPSLAVVPFAIGEVTERLKHLASRLVHSHGPEDHFEESVGHFEDVWARETRGEPLVEVLVTRTQESFMDPLALGASMTAVVDDAGPVLEMRDWEVVPEDWWKTSFRAISWSYKECKTKPGYPRPPHYHNLLARGRRRRIVLNTTRDEEDVDLNEELSGVRATEAVLKRYEAEVSILSPDDIPDNDSPVERCLDVLTKEDWDDKVQELLGGILQLGPLPEVDTPPPGVTLWDLSRLENESPPPRSPSTAELTDSETSVESDPPPSTPKPSKTSYARVVSSETVTSPTVHSPLPSKLLSAAALTFIPSTPTVQVIREPITPPLTAASNSSGDSPFSSPTYNFHFPSLKSMSPADRRESRSLPPSLQKDESGFYVEVVEDVTAGTTQSLNATRSTTPRRPSAALLPSFLTDGSPSPRPRNSKTREIVDRLRSSGSSGSSRKAKKSERSRRQPSTSATAKDGESDSAKGSTVKAEDATDGWIPGSVSEDTSTGLAITDDGWIIQGGSASHHQQQPQHQPQQDRPKTKGHGHKRSSGSISATSQTSSAPHAPHTTARPASQLPPMPSHMYPGAVPVPYAPYPTAYPGATPAFLPIQHPMQARSQPWPVGYQAPTMYPMYQPFSMMPTAPYGMVPMAPVPQPPAFYDGKAKPGGALVQ